MQPIRFILYLTLLSLVISGCSDSHKKRHRDFSSVPMHTYHERVGESDALIYHYLIYSNGSLCPCYSYESPTVVSNFSYVSFQRVESVPPSISSTSTTEEPVVEVETASLSTETSTGVTEAFNENFDSNDSHESGGAEEGFDESSQSESSDGGSSDGGGSDGGSDGGGGDGGGGGGE